MALEASGKRHQVKISTKNGKFKHHGFSKETYLSGLHFYLLELKNRQHQQQNLSACILFFILAAAKSLQSCPTLCDPTDGSPSGSTVPGILQARTLERVAISFFNA